MQVWIDLRYRFLAENWRARQDERDFRADAGLAVDKKRTAGLLGETMRRRKAEAGAAAPRLGRKKRLGRTRRDIGRHAAAGILDREDDVRAEPQALTAELAGRELNSRLSTALPELGLVEEDQPA